MPMAGPLLGVSGGLGLCAHPGSHPAPRRCRPSTTACSSSRWRRRRCARGDALLRMAAFQAHWGCMQGVLQGSHLVGGGRGLPSPHMPCLWDCLCAQKTPGGILLPKGPPKANSDAHIGEVGGVAQLQACEAMEGIQVAAWGMQRCGPSGLRRTHLYRAVGRPTQAELEVAPPCGHGSTRHGTLRRDGPALCRVCRSSPSVRAWTCPWSRATWSCSRSTPW